MSEIEYRSELALAHKAIKAAIASVTVPSAENFAKATYEELRKLAVSIGQQESEVRIYAPGEPRFFQCETPQWTVSWEAGPYEWAIAASMMYPILVEPYYSFDLSFYPGEDGLT